MRSLEAPKTLLVAVAGRQGAGKTTQINLLTERGFTPVSPPRIIRDYAREEHYPLRERRDWAAVRRRLTQQRGPNWLLDEVLKTAAEQAVDGVAALALDGLSTLYDQNVLRSQSVAGKLRCVEVALVCQSRKVRFDRCNDPSKDPGEFDDWRQTDKREAWSRDPSDLHVMNRQRVVDRVPESNRIDTEHLSPDIVHERLWALVEPHVLELSR